MRVLQILLKTGRGVSSGVSIEVGHQSEILVYQQGWIILELEQSLWSFI